MEIDSPEKYSEGTLNYIGAASSTKSSSGKVYVGAVHNGSSTLDLRIKKNNSSGAGSGGSAGSNNPSLNTSSSDYGRFTMYVQNSSGTAADWTGYMFVGDLEWNSKQHEDFLISNASSIVLQQAYKNDKIGTCSINDKGGWHVKAKSGTTDSANAFAILKVHIPTDGITIGFAADESANSISLYFKNTSLLSSSYGVEKSGGGWSAY